MSVPDPPQEIALDGPLGVGVFHGEVHECLVMGPFRWSN